MGRRLAALLAVTAVLAVACGAPSPDVAVERSDITPSADVDDGVFDRVEDDTTAGDDDPDGDTNDPDDESTTTTPTATVDPDAIDEDSIDFGDDKPERFYDDFLLAALADVERWLADEFPDAFGQPWEPLEGAVYAGYPERRDPIPGCGEPETSYEDLQLFVAFYCPIGDFIVYDDGDEPIQLGGQSQPPILFSLANEYGPATIGIVLAHEYGHAVQSRTGALDRSLPTVTTEQQADCIAGAWAGRAAAGLASGIEFSDADVRAGLISMITVQDPVGTNPNAPGGHGSGFDRVGAFQVGFRDGLARCAELIDDPLPLTPLRFSAGERETTGGDAPYGFGENELFGFLVPDLNLLYGEDLDVAFPDFEPLELVPTNSASEAECDDPAGDYDIGVLLCPSANTVFLNEPVARTLYTDFGDFGPGYLLGIAWADAAQLSTGLGLTGEERQLLNDCLAGNWVRTVIPDVVTDPATGLDRLALPQPRDPGRSASVSPNDLTEAIQTVIVIGDEFADDNVIGTAFEKVDAFRRGILDGLAACI